MNEMLTLLNLKYSEDIYPHFIRFVENDGVLRAMLITCINPDTDNLIRSWEYYWSFTEVLFERFEEDGKILIVRKDVYERN
jgi:hypothetical protein